MRVALHTTFRANKKEPLAALLERIHTAFLTSGVGEPSIALFCSDAPVAGFTSGVERLLKRHPELARLAVTGSMLPGGPLVRQIAAEGVDFSTVATIAAGVPQSFPFHNVSVHFQSHAFGLERPAESRGVVMPGVIVGDSWWVSGRERSVSALTVVEADPSGGKLPPLPEPVAAVFAVCGKVKSTASPAQTQDVCSRSTSSPVASNSLPAKEARQFVRTSSTRKPRATAWSRKCAVRSSRPREWPFHTITAAAGEPSPFASLSAASRIAPAAAR